MGGSGWLGKWEGAGGWVSGERERVVGCRWGGWG